MEHLILTGASRGIGRALALALAGREHHVHLIARDEAALHAVAADVRAAGGQATVHVADLADVHAAHHLGVTLVSAVPAGATLVHNAGIWPSKRERGGDGLERAFVVNHVAPLALQAPLLAEKRLRRLLVVSAGLLIKGRFDASRTPTGADFSAFRTYCTTKLALAVAMRDVAAAHPHVDVAVIHPGVVRTDLGARSGPLGWLLGLVKRGWEDPSVTGARLARVVAKPRWSRPGEASWLVEEVEQPWPAIADDEAVRRAVREASALHVPRSPAHAA